MRNSKLGTAGLVVSLFAAIACGSESRDFGDGDAGAAGEDGSGGTAGVGSGGTAGTHAGTGGGGTSGSGGTDAVGGSSGSGGDAGATGDVGGAAGSGGDGASGEGGAASCPKNSCCIADKTIARDAVDPANACNSCQPHRSTSDWSDRNGEICKSETAFNLGPKATTRLSSSCGEGGCAEFSVAPTAEQMLVRTPTIPKDELVFDFSNLRASSSLSVTKAVFRIRVKAEGPPQSVGVFVGEAASAACTATISSKTYVDYDCDVTAAIKNWMTLPANAVRSLTIRNGNTGNPVTVITQAFATASQRPALRIDYSASCEGDRCITITK